MSVYKFCNDFSYVVNKTLTGEKLLVGIRKMNSYVLIHKPYVEAFHSLCENSMIGTFDYEANSKESTLIRLFKNKGYFEGYPCTRSFNEVEMVGKQLFSYHFKEKSLKHTNNVLSLLFCCVYCAIFLMLFTFIVANVVFLNSLTIDVKTITFLEVLVCFTLIPFMINFLHELYHYVVARILNISLKSFKISFFISFPIYFLDYNGINLHMTTHKLCVISAGILSHLVNILIGIFLYKSYQNNILLVWIIANMSMIVTNISLISPSDGYYFLSNLLGVYNLRRRGYLSLRTLFNKNEKWNKDYCGFYLLLGILLSVVAFYRMFLYYGNFFAINNFFLLCITLVLIILIVIRIIITI